MTPEQEQDIVAALAAYCLHLEGLASIFARLGQPELAEQISALALDAVKTGTPSEIHGQTLTKMWNESAQPGRVLIHAVDVSRIAWENAVTGGPHI